MSVRRGFNDRQRSRQTPPAVSSWIIGPPTRTPFSLTSQTLPRTALTTKGDTTGHVHEALTSRVCQSQPRRARLQWNWSDQNEHAAGQPSIQRDLKLDVWPAASRRHQ